MPGPRLPPSAEARARIDVGWVEAHQAFTASAREDGRLRPDVFAGYGETQRDHLCCWVS